MGAFLAGIGSAIGPAMAGVGNFMGPLMSSGGAGASGIMGFLSNIFQNKLLQQLLAAEGADLMGNTPGRNLGGAIQTNIASQNYMKVLEKMLGGQIPDGGKITQDSKGMTIAIPPVPMPSPQQQDLSGFSPRPYDLFDRFKSTINPFAPRIFDL